jgi:site-specific DNA recombinase
MDEKRKVVGYIRVSTREQAETKLSLTHQEEKIRAYASSKDLNIDHIYNDAAESAKDLNREAIRQLLADVEKGKIGHVIIYKLDRLIRNVENLGFLVRLFDKKIVTLSSVQESLDTSNASGRFVVNILGNIAQWEREQIQERTQAALDVKRRRGEKLGGIVPYGFRSRQGRLIGHPDEQKVLREVLKSRKGGEGYQDIAESLNKRKVKPRNGARWYASTIRSICLRAEKGPPNT